MNLWRCEVAHCPSIVFGVGEAFGLRAIGWDVRPRPPQDPHLLCPAHRLDMVPCRRPGLGKALCSHCAAELEAGYWAQTMRLHIPTELREKIP